MDALPYSTPGAVSRNALRPLAAVLAVLASVAPAAAAPLTCTVTAVEFKDAYDGRQLIVSDGDRDVTRTAQYASDNPAVATVDAAGYVTPAGDGTTTVRVTSGTG